MSRYSQSMLHRSIKSKIFTTIFIIIIIYSAIMFTSTTISIDRKEIVSSNIPRSFHNTTVVYASDFLYNGGSTFYLDNVISTINSLRADIVILGGNYGNSFENSLKFFDSIPNIHSNMGVYAVLGENDINKEARDDYSLERRMAKKNIKKLVNETIKIKKDGEEILIYGIDDIKNGNADFQIIEQKNDDLFTIFACNSAKGVEKILDLINNGGKENLTDIALFGSTLGGQYILNAKIQKIINPVDSPKFFTGWHGNNKNNILISNGIGARDFGFRIGVPPQIHIINIKYR